MVGARGVATVLLLAALAACTSTPPTTTPPQPSTDAVTSPPPSEPPVSADSSRAPDPTPELPGLGRPYDAAEILEIMAASRRPGGVPAALRTEEVARQVAGAIWTYRGEPWATSAAGGSCGPSVCTLELAGTLEGGQGEDLWVFEVADGAATLVTAELRAMPPELVEELDAIARSVEPAIDRHELELGTVTWLLPAERGRFRLSYRSGGEEGSCRIDLVIDARDGSLDASEIEDC
jgi:hypothetical protein